MKTADKSKLAGLSSLAEHAELDNKTTQTLRTYDREKPELFQASLDRAVKKKNEAKNEN